jgi:hypothetical protein
MSRMIHFRWAVLVAVGVAFWLGFADTVSAQQSDVSQVGWWRPRVCPPEAVPAYPAQAAPGAAQPGAVQPAPQAQPQPAETAPPISALAGEFGGAEGPMGVPNMIGDLPGIRPAITASGFVFSNPMAAGAGQFKISDNENPMPTDRVFFNYNQYQNALSFNDGVAVSDSPMFCYVFGVEKTFLNGLCSVEFRVPFAEGYASVQTPTVSAVTGTEFGNIPIVFKTLLHNGERNVITGGVAVTLPTARDVNINSGELVIQNGSCHLQPYLMWLFRPRERLFFMAFAGVDFDAGVNDVFTDSDGFVGRYHDQALLFFDGKIGYWLYKNPCRRWLTGIIPTIELHYTSTMQDAPTVVDGAGTGVTPLTLRQDVLNLTGGIHFELGQRSDLVVGGSLPLRTSAGDKLFDSEFVVQFNRRF